MRSLSESFPCSYAVWKDSSTTPATIRAESNVAGGTDYNGTDASTVIQAAISNADCESLFVKGAQYDCVTTLTLKSKLRLFLENYNTELRATAAMTRLIDARNLSQVQIAGGKINGHNLAATVIDFTQTAATVTHNRLDYSHVCGATSVANSCLVNITGNSGFQAHEPILDGRVDGAGGTDSAQYGLILDSSGGQNTIWPSDGWNFCSVADIRLGGGYLTIIGGSLNGGSGTASNIKITSTTSGGGLSVVGTWMESNADNILLVEGAFAPAYVDVMPSYMSAGGAAGAHGYANIRSTTTANHLGHLRTRGGTWVNYDTQATIYNINCVATTADIDKTAYGSEINLANFTYYIVSFHGGYSLRVKSAIETSGKLYSAGAQLSSELDISNNTALRWRNAANNAWLNILYINNADHAILNLYDGLISDPENVAVTTMTGLGKAIHIKIGAADYYLPCYTGYT
jgi:hypothetical protein